MPRDPMGRNTPLAQLFKQNLFFVAKQQGMKKKLVVLSGAGVSAESGLRTFRDSDGLWEGYNVYDVATPDAWAKDPQLVIEFYNMRRRDVANAMPNAAHRGIAWL